MFTLSQKKAHDYGRHLSITANAGSGKTRVLVSRYCDLIESGGVWPDQIAAITFTEKAASELRNKIAQELESRLSDEAHRVSWERLKLARERFTSAVVTTIHGFCSQMLREFPVETDVPPNFGVVSGYERRQIEEDSLMEAIEESLGDGMPPYTPGYITTRRVGRERVEEILQMMMNKREAIAFGMRRGALTLGREQTLERWRTAAINLLRDLVFNADTIPAFGELIGLLKEENGEEAQSLMRDARRADSIDELKEIVASLSQIFLTADRKGIRKTNYASKDQYEYIAEKAAPLVDAFGRASNFLEATGDTTLHEILYDDSRVLLAIHGEAVRRYEERKRRLNALDFEDLQLRLLAALEKPEERSRILGRFTHLMVDEFQDTNQLQYAIVNGLLDGLSRGRVCIVGDEKQSIYGFRNADVAVFKEATGDIRRSNRDLELDAKPFLFRREEIEPETRDEALGVVTLNASFRLLPGICAFVNEACRPIMRGGLASFGVDYEPLVGARRTNGPGRVEFLLPPPEPGPTDDDTACDTLWCPEGEMIARRLLKVIAEKEMVIWERDESGEEHPRGARFSDMAILCRKRSSFPPIEQALRKYGIPFIAHGSVGFYKTQEIYDVVNYLRVLLNARDEGPLYGVLRSPFFCVSDAEVMNARYHQPDPGTCSDLWSMCVSWVEMGGADATLARAVSMITEDRAMASRIPVSLLIRRILERTGWRGAVIGGERGEQAEANVDKLLSMAREFEERGFTNLFDFIERLNALIDLEEMEGEASVNSGRDAVRIMTMHAAKGLEFPIVVLPSLHSPPRGSSAPYFDKEMGFGWNWKFDRQEYKPMATAVMGLREAERGRAEEARLFYVACTRARDMLIVSGELDPKKRRAETMLAWALAPLGEYPEENERIELRSDGLGFLEEDGTTMRSRTWTQEIRIHTSIEDLPRYMAYDPQPLPFDVDAVQIGELPARAQGEIYSATQFMVYTHCPTKYYLMYRLGIPEELGAAYGILPDTRDGEEGTIFARLFRLAARRLDEMRVVAAPLPRGVATNGPQTKATERSPQQAVPFSSDPLVAPTPVQIDLPTESPVASIIDETLLMEPLLAAEVPGMRARLIETFERILAAPEARAALFNDGDVRVEQELRLPFEKEYLLGVMDRMLIAPTGTISILHYKTLRLPEEKVEEAARGYLPQLRLYAYLASLLNPKQRSTRATLLFTEHPDKPQSFTFTRFDMQRIEEELRSSIADIRALSYTGRRELPTRTPHCPSCPYWIEGRCLVAPR